MQEIIVQSIYNLALMIAFVSMTGNIRFSIALVLMVSLLKHIFVCDVSRDHLVSI